METMNSLWKSQRGVVAVIEHESKRLISLVRNSDLHLLLDNYLFNNRMSLTAEQFIRMDAGKVDSDATIKGNLRDLLSSGGSNF